MTPLLQKEFNTVFRLLQGQAVEESNSGNKQQEDLKKMIMQNSSPENKKRIEEELFGYGPLENLIHRPHINEIIINNHKHIAYEEEGHIHLLEDSFLSYLTFNNIVEKLSAEASLTVNLKKPFAEGKWRDFRIHIIRPPLVEKDFHVILRRHPKNIWTFDKLLNKSWAPPGSYKYLKGFYKRETEFPYCGTHKLR